MKKTVVLLAILSLGTLGWARAAWQDATDRLDSATSAGAVAASKPVWSPVGSFGGSGEDGVGAAKTDADGNLYVIGFFSATATFQRQVLVSSGDADIYLAKFDPRGHLQWIVQAGGVGLDEGCDLAFDAKGNIYAVGWFSDSATFQSANGQSKTVNGYVHENPFLVKYSPFGQLLWLRSGGSLDFDTGNNRAWGLAVNPKTGTIYMTGYAEGTTYFSTSAGPDQPVTGPYPWHTYLVKYDTQGNFQWGITNAAEGNSIGYKVAVDKQDNAYVVGWFENFVTFSSRDGKDQTVTAFSTPAPPDYDQDVFLVKYDTNGNLKWVNHAGGYRAIADNLAVSDDGKITITGVIGNINTGSPSQAETIITSQPGGADINLGGGQLTDPYNWDMFLATYDQSGVLKNATRIGGPDQDFGAGITYDQQGNLYVTGIFGGLVDFGGITLNGTAAYNVFVVKYGDHGNHGPGFQADWAEAILGAGSLADYQETGPRVWVEGQGPGKGIIVSGPYQGTAAFGNFELNSAGDDDVYVMKLIHK